MRLWLPHAKRRDRLWATALAVACTLLAHPPGEASARSIRARIVSPHAGKVVPQSFTVRLRLRHVRGHYSLRVQLDGATVARTAGRGRGTVRRKIVVGSPVPGPHRLRVVARNRGHRSVSVRHIVSTDSPNSTSTPSPAGRLIFYEDFSLPARTGTMGSDNDPTKVIYTGANGTRWVTYPRSYLDTYNKRPYRSDQVLSVHDGTLDYHLRPVDGQPAGANPSPLITGNSQYQTYGRYSVRLKVDAVDLSEYHLAFLLWPKNDPDWEYAESDFPESDLTPASGTVTGWAHYGPGQAQIFGDPSIDIHNWHTYTQEWLPGFRRYYVDDRMIAQTASPVYSGPERWQLQIETKGNGGHDGHVLVDWAAVYAF